MKTLVCVFIIMIGLCVNETFADNKPVWVSKDVIVDYDGLGAIRVWVNNCDADASCDVKIYDFKFHLVHSGKLGSDTSQFFDISKFADGYYFILVQRENETIYTEVVEKTQGSSFAKY